MTYKHPDRIEMYAAALQSDINAERFQQVVAGKLKTYWIGTVYGVGVATARGYKCAADERIGGKAYRLRWLRELQREYHEKGD